MVGQALRTLRLAQRLSELPEGLADWSGQQFLRIRFDDARRGGAAARARRGRGPRRRAAGHRQERRAARRHGAAAAPGVRAAMPEGRAGRDAQARRRAAHRTAAGRADPRRVLRRPAAHRGDRPVLHDGRAAGPPARPRPTVARGRAVPRQPHRPGLGGLPAGAAVRGGPRARRAARLHDGPLRRGRAQRVPPDHPAAQRRRPAGGPQVPLRSTPRSRRALDALDEPDGSGRVDATRVFRRPALAD